MSDDERLLRLLRGALPPMAVPGPARDLWPLIVQRGQAPAWSWSDIGLAAVLVALLVACPRWLLMLAYHL